MKRFLPKLLITRENNVSIIERIKSFHSFDLISTKNYSDYKVLGTVF